jgi:hypothetical protein
VATGGLGLAGRGVASAVSKTRLSSWAAGNVNSGGLTGSVANMTNKAMRWSQKSSMDMRNTKLMDLANKGVSSFGVKLNDKVSGNIGLGAKDYVGGNLKIKADREKEIIEKASKRNDFSHLSDKEVEAVWDKYTKNKVGISVESSEEAKKINETTEVFKQNLKTAEANLQKAKSEGTRYEQDMATNKLNTSKKELEDRLSKEKEDKDKLYKEAIKKEGYGKVSNAKELSEAMRNDYAKSMLESSLYLSGGEKRTIPLGAGGAVGAIGSYATGLIGGLSGGALFTNYIDSLQESDKKAFEKITKDYKKAHSKKDNKILALQSKLEEIDSFVDSHIEGVLSGTGLTMEDIKKDEKLRETHFDRAKAKADREYVDAEEAYINAKNDYKSNKNTNTSTEFEKQARNYQKKKDNLNDLNNAKKNRDTAQNNLDKEKDRVKDKEDKTKGAEKKESDKPKDSK